MELNSSSCTNDNQETRAATAFGDAQPADSPTDVQLMARIAAGDGDAFQELVKMHGPQLVTFIGRLTAWHADRDDLLQETLLAVWDNARGYDERGTLRQWLFQIAGNRVKNYFRATQRLKRRLEKFAALRPSSSNYTQTNTTHLELASSALSRALGELSFADRKLIVLHHLEEVPAEQIALEEGIRVETVYVRLHRARSRLRVHLEKSHTGTMNNTKLKEQPR